MNPAFLSLSAPTRRDLLSAAAGCLGAAGVPAFAAEPRKVKVSIFTKHLQFLRGEALATAIADMGFDGADVTVRTGGHIDPAKAVADLPPLVKLLREHGVQVQMVTTGITGADAPYAEEIIRTLSQLDIRYYRVGFVPIDPNRPILGEIEALKPKFAQLAALNSRYQVCGMCHTHSGPALLGASIWDLHLILKDLDPKWMGFNYDVGHATVEGGFAGWINSFSLTGQRLRGVGIKDFVWGKDDKGAWRPRWQPVGAGMVRFPEFFAMLGKTPFSGPLQMSYEYPLGGAESGKQKITIGPQEVYAAMVRDLKLVRGWLSQNGLG